MANRIPLILDTSTDNKLRELPLGDNLDLSGSSIVNVQNITVAGSLTAPDLIVSYNNLTNKPNVPVTLLDLNIAEGTNGQVLSTDGDGNYTFVDPVIFELSVAKLSELENDVGYITADGLDSIAINATGNLTGNIYSYDSTLLVDAENGNIDYNILINKPYIPTAIGDLEDDISLVKRNEFNSLGGFVSSLSSRVSTVEGQLFTVSTLQTTVSNLQTTVNNATGSISSNTTRIQNLETTVPQKADSSSLSTLAFTGNYTDMASKPGLEDLIDVNIAGTPIDGQALVWDNGTGNWIPGGIPAGVGGATSLSALTDVDVSGAIDGSVLKYNTTSNVWEIGTDNLGTGGGSFDQSLNTTDSVEFVSVTAEEFVSSGTGTPAITSATNLELEAGNAINFKINGQLEAFIDSSGINIGGAVSGNFEGTLAGNVIAPVVITTPKIAHTSAVSTELKIGDPETSTIDIEADSVSFTANSISGLPGSSVSYTPANPANWTGTAPTTIQEAIDRIAAFINTNIGPIT